MISLPRRLVVEALGTAILLCAVVGSGIMAEQLSGGNVGVALLANAIATGCILFVLITMMGPLSGAHFNPVVSLVMVLSGDIKPVDALLYCLAQIAGGIAGVLVAHGMFDLDILQQSTHVRAGPGQNIAELVATFGLVTTIYWTRTANQQAIAASVALYITSAYWFTASTSFANPAATVARSLTNTFAGIQPGGIWAFIAFQLLGALLATILAGWMGLLRTRKKDPEGPRN